MLFKVYRSVERQNHLGEMSDLILLVELDGARDGLMVLAYGNTSYNRLSRAVYTFQRCLHTNEEIVYHLG